MLPYPSFSVKASGCLLKGKKGAVSLTSMETTVMHVTLHVVFMHIAGENY